MSAEKLARLFEPFNRLGAESSSIEGTGIGLVLSRRLAELMQGELHIHSELGAGPLAMLILDRTDAPFVRTRSPSPPSQHGALEQPLRVLYAEDNEVNVELVRQVVLLSAVDRIRRGRQRSVGAFPGAIRSARPHARGHEPR